MKTFVFVVCCSGALVGCTSGDVTDDNDESSRRRRDASSAVSSARVGKQPSAVEERLYDGMSLEAWRQRIKDLDPNDPQSAQAVGGLIAIISDENVPSFSRRQAAMTLGRMGSKASEAVGVLVELFEKSQPDDDATRLWVTKALALFGPQAKPAAPALIRWLCDRRVSFVQRAAAMEAISQIGTADRNVVPTLIDLLGKNPTHTETDRRSDDPEALRALAAESIGVIGPGAASAVPALIRATRAKNENIRRQSVKALGAMGRGSDIAVPALIDAFVFDESAAVRQQASQSLARVGAAAVEALSRLLQAPDAQLRLRAASSLAIIGRPAQSAVANLRPLLEDEEAKVRLAAVEALWKITRKTEPLLPVLVEELANRRRSLRMQAVTILSDMGPQARDAVEPLTKLLDDRRSYVRTAAKKALSKIQTEE